MVSNATGYHDSFTNWYIVVSDMLNPNLMSDLLFGHSRHTNCIGRAGGGSIGRGGCVETSVATDASPLNNCISCQVKVEYCLFSE